MPEEHEPTGTEEPPIEGEGEGEGEGDSNLVRQLRQQLKDKDKALDSVQPVIEKQAFSEAGVDIESAQGKMLLEVARSRKAPFTKDGISALATEFGIEASPEGGGGEGGEGDEGPPGRIGGDDGAATEDQRRTQAANRADGVMDAAASVPGFKDREAILQEIDRAQEAGDPLTVIHLQRQLSNVPK